MSRLNGLTVSSIDIISDFESQTISYILITLGTLSSIRINLKKGLFEIWCELCKYCLFNVNVLAVKSSFSFPFSIPPVGFFRLKILTQFIQYL